ncbi:alpha/beta fold hydrolase [Glutamicibacter sp. PS]|uniref:alpha/beta hydrolase n=1 Tax=Glutamicibacter sp. PS TaxID=3075634 RepID=UPI00284707DF|nr:alpha/beta fold hydrolase [Glutamicibacter sp. PS]MDR4533256.1 alpha/beta fold hydrolase [Glutamicibacter sp. PS]
MNRLEQAAPAGRDAVLLIHGFTGSTAAMKPWAEHFERQGFATATPVLPGHETRWQDMLSVPFGEWIAATEQAFDDLQARHARVFVAGLSMGGALALHLATRRNVAGVSLVNPGLIVDNRVAPYTKWLRLAVRSVKPIANDIARPGADERAYPRTPVAAVAQLYALFAQVRARLPLVDAPVQLFRSSVDHVVSDESVRALTAGLRPGILREQVSLPDSRHVATLDYDASLIFERSAQFFTELVADGEGLVSDQRQD